MLLVKILTLKKNILQNRNVDFGGEKHENIY